MKKIILMTLCLLTNYGAMADNSKLLDIKEGQWKLTSTAKMSGIAVEMPPMTTTSIECMTKENALDPRIMLKNQNCEMVDMVIQTNTAKWKMNCSQQGIKMIGDGVINYQQQSFTGVINMNILGEVGTMKIITKITGQYLGVCQQ